MKPMRVVPSPPAQGLGELYERDYLQAVVGAADDKVGPGRVALERPPQHPAWGVQGPLDAKVSPRVGRASPHSRWHCLTPRRRRRCGSLLARSSPRCAPSWTHSATCTSREAMGCAGASTTSSGVCVW
jgi:hypothetical protein